MSLVFVVGTRPEAIKVCPVILEAKERGVPHIVVSSGQHLHLLDSVFSTFGVTSDVRLETFKDGQSLSSLASALFSEFDKLGWGVSDTVTVHGDTLTSLVAAQVAFFSKAKVAHIEAGLRTGVFNEPFPEEFNRRAISLVADYNFAPTKLAEAKLSVEGCHGKVFMVGNTAIDAVRMLSKDVPAPLMKRCLVTVHRRENIPNALPDLCKCLLHMKNNGWHIVWPMHPNPTIKDQAKKLLGTAYDLLEVVQPLEYQEMIREMTQSELIITDSGGIQEEATFLKKPTIVFRDVTERPEAVSYGTAFLAGNNYFGLLKGLKNFGDEWRPPTAPSPFGDGFASKRIIDVLGVL